MVDDSQSRSNGFCPASGVEYGSKHFALYDLFKAISGTRKSINTNYLNVLFDLGFVQCFFYPHGHLIIECKDDITLAHDVYMLTHFQIGFIFLPAAVNDAAHLKRCGISNLLHKAFFTLY
ncbi:hypothetical protein D3C73_796110 [compost metagenome]